MLVGSDQQTDRQTMSVIELSWTAKKKRNSVAKFGKIREEKKLKYFTYDMNRCSP